MRAAVALVALTALAACSTGPRLPPAAFIERALAGAPGEAQPSTLVATELAYAREAREIGQYTAAANYAAPGARLHARNGPVPFAALGDLPDPEQAVAWSPRVVAMSCNGATAVTLGRFQDQEGFVGNYVTVWRRNAENEYRWIYDVAGRDDPQPPPRAEFEDGDIVVTAIDAIEGRIADCPRRDAAVPPPPALSLASEDPGEAFLSRDGTLRWRWEHQADGTKFVAVEYYFQGEWQTAIEERLASPAE